MEEELENLVEEKIYEGLDDANDVYDVCLNCLKQYFKYVELVADDSYYGNSSIEFKLTYLVKDEQGEENKIYFFIDYHWKDEYIELLSIQFI